MRRRGERNTTSLQRKRPPWPDRMGFKCSRQPPDLAQEPEAGLSNPKLLKQEIICQVSKRTLFDESLLSMSPRIVSQNLT